MEDTATTLTDRKLGNRWTKSDKLDRVYINEDTLYRLAGIELPGPNETGTLLDGELISNNHARQIREAFRFSKIYYDVPANKWILQEAGSLHRDGRAALHRAYAAIQDEVK